MDIILNVLDFDSLKFGGKTKIRSATANTLFLAHTCWLLRAKQKLCSTTKMRIFFSNSPTALPTCQREKFYYHYSKIGREIHKISFHFEKGMDGTYQFWLSDQYSSKCVLEAK